jgi:hypothetical protein
VNEIREWLRANDPLRDDSGLSEQHVFNIRRRLLQEAAQPATRASWDWRRPAIGVFALAALVAFGVVSMQEPPSVPEPGVPQGSAVAPIPEKRQLHFLAPGGTRIIWTVNDNLNLAR